MTISGRLFGQGELVYHASPSYKRVLRLEAMKKVPFYWNIYADQIVHDGLDYGYETEVVFIRPYEGYKPLEKLNVYPLRYHPRRESISEFAIARGKKFLSLQEGTHHLSYEGLVDTLSPFRKTGFDGEEDEYPIQSITVSGIT
jgi:hypothetical protein